MSYTPDTERPGRLHATVLLALGAVVVACLALLPLAILAAAGVLG